MKSEAQGQFNQRLREERLHRRWSQQDLANHLGTTVVTISRWENGVSAPSPYFRLKLSQLFSKSAQESGLVPENPLSLFPAEVAAGASAETLPSSPHSSGLWGVPYPRNPFFTGREALLHLLHERLNHEGAMALTQSWAISGLGGIGKTQIALEYAYQHRQDYRFVFWVGAATKETLLAGFRTIAELLQLPEKDKHDQNLLILAVKKWFAAHHEWLLILDNVDDIAMVHGYYQGSGWADNFWYDECYYA